MLHQYSEIRNIITTVHVWVKILKLLRIGDIFIVMLSLSLFLGKGILTWKSTLHWTCYDSLYLFLFRFFSASFAFVCSLMWSLSTVFILVQVCHSAFMTARPAKMKAVLDPQRFYHFFRSLCSFSEVMSKKPPAFRMKAPFVYHTKELQFLKGIIFLLSRVWKLRTRSTSFPVRFTH